MGTSISDELGSCIISIDDNDGAGSMFPLNVILCVPVYMTLHPPRRRLVAVVGGGSRWWWWWWWWWWWSVVVCGWFVVVAAAAAVAVAAVVTVDFYVFMCVHN
jgi:hypothetical protein